MTSRAIVAVSAVILSGCGSPALPTAAVPATQASPPRPALIVTTMQPGRPDGPPRDTWVSVYTIGDGGRLSATAAPLALGAFHAVHAASYFADSGLFQQVVSETTFEDSGVTPIVTYEVDLRSGILTRLGSSQLSRPASSIGLYLVGTVAFHPSGRFVYASSSPRQIDGYELDPRTGALLRPIPGSPFTWAAPIAATDVTFAPSGRFAWAAGTVPGSYHGNLQHLLGFAADPVTGVLRNTSAFDVFDRYSNLALDPRGSTAYLIDRSNRRLGRFTWRRFAVDPAGTLVEAAARGDEYAGGLAWSASGRFLLSVFDSDGLALLEPVDGAAVAERARIAISASPTWDARRPLHQVGDFVYVGGERGISVVKLDEAAAALELLQTIVPPDGQNIVSVVLARPLAP